jgi:ASC-1-like (ASCH) protein
MKEITDEDVDEILEEFSSNKKRGNPNLKGRIKGAMSKNLVKDDLLHPYYIKIDGSKSYTVLKEDSTQVVGYYTTFQNALKRIALEKVDVVEVDTERTLKEYLQEF